MKMSYSQLIFCLILTCSIFACQQDDYYIDGGLSQQSDEQKNLTTYEFLRQNTDRKFDSLVRIIDLTNTKDIVNKNNITFYALTNSAIIRFQQRLMPADRQKRPLDKIGTDTLKMLLNRFIVPDNKVSLDDVNPNILLNLKDNNKDSIQINGEGGGLVPGSNTPGSAYRMRYSHMKIPKVDSVIYRSGIQTHNIQTANAVIHVLADDADFGCGLKVKYYR